MTSWVKLTKWLRRGPTATGDGFESWKDSKSFEKKLKNSFFATISHGYYIYKTNHITTKQKRWMVKVYQHYHEYLVRILRQQGTTIRQTQGGRSTREQRDGRRSENRRDLVCLKALWTENRSMEGGHTQSMEVVGD